LLRKLERKVLANATSVYGISPASSDALARTADRTDVGVLPIPVDLVHFAPEPDERWLTRLETPTVTFVGRADDPRKNVDLLLDAWPSILEAFPTAQLALVGRPPRRSVPRGVAIRGEVVDVAEELRSTTLLVVPSLQEGFSIAAAEALACGVPVVSTPSGGPEHLLKLSGGGRLLDGFEPHALVAAVIDLLEHPSELIAMRHKGRAYVEVEHSPETFRQRLDRLLN
jgi:phosphatidylinositol alpha-mannosyltransferase